MTSQPYFIGIDLGGTQLRMAAVTTTGQLATELLSVPTGKGLTAAALTRALQLLNAQVTALMDGQPSAGWGVGVAGVIWERRLTGSDNLPLLNGIDIEALIGTAAGGLPVALENDARCFVLAEARFGAARAARHVCGVTLGTGCGGGVMVDGQLVHGAQGAAGEIWSIPLREHFLEYYLSGEGLVRTYAAAGGNDSAGTSPLTAAAVAQRARAGEAAARQAWQTYGDDVYFLCETLMALLQPEVIVIGGSMAQAHDLFGEKFTEKLRGRATRIALAELGAAAGVIGAASLLQPRSTPAAPAPQ